MLTTVRMSLRAGMRGAVSITLVLLVFSTFAAACSDPEPPPLPPRATTTPELMPTATPPPLPPTATATPEPTPTATPTPLPPTATATPEPTPTATPTPLPPTATATPEPTPDSMTSEPDAGSVEDFVIMESTTMGDLMAVLSKGEVSCVRDLFGDAIQGVPLANLPDIAYFLLDCLAPESAVSISVAMMASAAGGFSAETRECVTALATEDPVLLGLGEPPEDSPALYGKSLQMSLCLTEEEAAALGESTLEERLGAVLLDPMTARCLLEQLGGEEVLMKLSSGELDESAMPGIFAAAQACGLELGGAPLPPDDILVWQYETGNPGEMVIVSPTLADGVLYAGSYEGFVYALDAATGELLWRFETENDQNLPPEVALVNPPPTVADGIVYVVRAGGELFALDAYTGERLWNDEPVYADSLLSDGIRYMPDLDFDAPSLNVRAIDESSGDLRWEADVPRSSMLPLIFPLTASGQNIYVSDDYQVHALDSTTGRLAWSFDAGDIVQDPPGVSDGVVYLRSYSAAYALDESTGEQLWRYEVDSGGFEDRPPFITDGVWALVDGVDAVQGLDTATGQPLWSYEPDDPDRVIFVSGVSNGMVYVTDDEAFHALDAATGRGVWSLDAGWGLGDVTVVDGVLYANSQDGYLHTFDARTGEPFWSVEIGYHLGGAGRPYLVSGGVVYVGYLSTTWPEGEDVPSSGVYALSVPGSGR